MFDVDELLGRAALRERIDDLEDECDRLRARYEAESERRAEAATARQDAEERVNRLEDRIAQLEGELERADAEATGPSFRRRDRLRGVRTEAVLDRLSSVRTGPEGALTATLAGDGAARDRFGDELASVLGDRQALLDDAAPCLCCVDDAGLVAVALDPPIRPSREPTWDDRFRLEREWFLPTGEYALALVRADLFAVGRYADGDRVDYRGFESDVKGAHSKGGFSQARFERIRDDQIDAHLDRCAETLTAFLSDDDRLLLVGQRGVLEALTGEIALDPTATAPVDATGDPEAALADAHRAFWTTDLAVL